MNFKYSAGRVFCGRLRLGEFDEENTHLLFPFGIGRNIIAKCPPTTFISALTMIVMK
jgi:hypothetical protein